MTSEEILDSLRELGAVLGDDHIVYTSGRHGSAYVNKDAVYPHTFTLAELCREMARRWADDQIEVVVAPAVGGVILSTWVAHALSVLTGKQVLSVYAEKETVGILDPEGLGRTCFAETGHFVLKRGYDKLVAGKRVLVVEDVLTTGGSVRKVVDAVRNCGGNVVGVMALCNRGNVTVDDVGGVPRLDELVDLTLESWAEEECPLCRDNIPINTTVGKGAEFLARRTS